MRGFFSVGGGSVGTFVPRRVLLLGLALAFSGPLAAQAAPILSTSGTTPFGGSPRTAGWKFTTGSSQLSVTHLDAILNNGHTSTQVRLYNSAQTILGSATVSSTDPTVTAGLTWRSKAVTPFTLNANTTYYIVQDMPGNLNVMVFTSTPVMSLGVAYNGGVTVSGTGGLPLTDGTFNGGVNPAFFGPNFEAIVAVPEPAGAALLLVLAGIPIVRGRRR